MEKSQKLLPKEENKVELIQLTKSNNCAKNKAPGFNGDSNQLAESILNCRW